MRILEPIRKPVTPFDFAQAQVQIVKLRNSVQEPKNHVDVQNFFWHDCSHLVHLVAELAEENRVLKETVASLSDEDGVLKDVQRYASQAADTWQENLALKRDNEALQARLTNLEAAPAISKAIAEWQGQNPRSVEMGGPIDLLGPGRHV